MLISVKAYSIIRLLEENKENESDDEILSFLLACLLDVLFPIPCGRIYYVSSAQLSAVRYNVITFLPVNPK